MKLFSLVGGLNTSFRFYSLVLGAVRKQQTQICWVKKTCGNRGIKSEVCEQVLTREVPRRSILCFMSPEVRIISTSCFRYLQNFIQFPPIFLAFLLVPPPLLFSWLTGLSLAVSANNCSAGKCLMQELQKFRPMTQVSTGQHFLHCHCPVTIDILLSEENYTLLCHCWTMEALVLMEREWSSVTLSIKGK